MAWKKVEKITHHVVVNRVVSFIVLARIASCGTPTCRRSFSGSVSHIVPNPMGTSLKSVVQTKPMSHLVRESVTPIVGSS
jgi:hypothetical protein